MKAEKESILSVRIHLLGRSGLVYEQDGMFACVDGEGLSGDPCRYVIVADSITRWDLPTSIPIGKDERASIIERIRSEFQREGCELVVEERGYDLKTASAYHDRIAGKMLSEFRRFLESKGEQNDDSCDGCPPQEVHPRLREESKEERSDNSANGG